MGAVREAGLAVLPAVAQAAMLSVVQHLLGQKGRVWVWGWFCQKTDLG